MENEEEYADTKGNSIPGRRRNKYKILFPCQATELTMCGETGRWGGGSSVAGDVMESQVGHGKDSVLYSKQRHGIT